MNPRLSLSTQALARACAIHPKRTVAIWGAVMLASFVVIALLLGGALTTDGDVTSNPESKQAAALIDASFPPEPTPSEIAHCRNFLGARIAALPGLRTILALGRIAHDSTLDALQLKRRDHPFSHGGRHELPTGHVLFDSYHCSRQNTNTGKLTTPMFEAVLSDIVNELCAAESVAGARLLGHSGLGMRARLPLRRGSWPRWRSRRPRSAT